MGGAVNVTAPLALSTVSNDVVFARSESALHHRRRPFGLTPSAAIRRVVEQRRELPHHRAAKLFGIHDRDRPPVIARHVMPDADRDQLHRAPRLRISFDRCRRNLEVGRRRQALKQQGRL